MMAASLVGTGSGASVDSHPQIPSSTHSPTLHEPSSATTFTTATAKSDVANGEEESEGGLESDSNSLSLAGRKLAVSSTSGLSASASTPESLPVQEDEKKIALSQLQELEVAIEVRKVTKVDGRKTRWIEYRRQRRASNLERQQRRKKCKPIGNGQMAKVLTDLKNPIKNNDCLNVKEKNVKQSNFKVNQLKKFIRNQSSLLSVFSQNGQISNEFDIVNNDTNNNNNIKIPSMKAEVSCMNNIIPNTFGTSTVLETMKQQFLEDTSKAVNNSLIISKSKIKKKKFTKTVKTITSTPVVTNGKFKKKARGRPKKMKFSKISKKSNSFSKTKVPVDSPTFDNGEEKDVPETLDSPKKSENFQGISQSTSEFYSRRNALTKGLREVRKSESGSESGGSSPLKDSSPLSRMSPSLPLAISPLPLSPVPSDSGSVGPYTKCPLIAAAAKALSSNSKHLSDESKKKSLKKNSKKESSNKVKIVNGHNSVANGSCRVFNENCLKEFQSQNLPTVKVGNEENMLIKKRPRGRPRITDGANSFKWSKRTSTIIADVHNTMNGEPQMVIPVNNPVVSCKKKKSPFKSNKTSTNDFHKEIQDVSELMPNLLSITSNKENSYLPTVPEDSCSPFHVSSPSKISKNNSTLSASRINDILVESGYEDSSKDITVVPSNLQDAIKSEKVPEVQSDEKLFVTNLENSIEKMNDIPKDIAYSNNNLEMRNESLVIDSCRGLSPLKDFDQPFSDSKSFLSKSANSCTDSDSVATEASRKLINSDRQRTILEFTKSCNLEINPVNLDNSLQCSQASYSANSLGLDILQENCQLQSVEALNLMCTNPLENANSTCILTVETKLEVAESSEESITLQDKNDVSIKSKKTPTKLTKAKSLNAVIEKLQSPSPKKPHCHNEISPLTKIIPEVDSQINKIKEECNDETSSNIELQSLNIEQSSLYQEEKTVNEKPIMTKTRDKVPRFLRQLFEDEGVQNMLRSMNEDNSINEGLANYDSGPHKLRPKRANDLSSDSPEPDETQLSQSHKRKKKVNESDNLIIDESALNLLSGFESLQRGSSAEESIQDGPQMDAKSTLSSSKQMDGLNIDSKKAKLSDTNSTALVCNPDYKKSKLLESETDMHKKASSSVCNITKPLEKNLQKPIDRIQSRKKPGRPTITTVPIQQKSKWQLQMVKKRMQKLGIKENMTVSQIKELLEKRKKEGLSIKTSKSVPPLKIKICHNTECKEQYATNHDRNSPNNSEEMISIPKTIDSSLSTSKPTSVKTSGFIDSLLENGNVSSPNDALKERHETPDGNSTLLPKPVNRPTSAASISPSFTSLVHSLEPSNNLQKLKTRVTSEGLRQSQRTSVRQSEGNYHYRDIQLRKYNNFIQIILTPSTTKMKNALNSRVLHELCEALSTIRRDESVRMVLLSSIGSIFCQGVDLTSLQHPNQEIRKKNAENLLRGIRDFLHALVQFPKLIVAGVNGNAMGLGVTMLPLFDMVIATDKAEFFLPYGKLGQVPEGGATYTFPYFFGKLQSTKLFLGHKITAAEATQVGLVSETLWPATFLQELLPKVASLASQSVQSMEATKSLMNHHLLTKLELSVESECRLLLQHWMSPTFTNLCKRFFDSHHIQLQKPVNLPL